MSDDPMDAMGKPIPFAARQAGYDALGSMCPELGADARFTMVGRVANALEQDQPYEALRLCTGAPLDRGLNTPVDPLDGPLLDVTGGYRLVATLLAGAA